MDQKMASVSIGKSLTRMIFKKKGVVVTWAKLNSEKREGTEKKREMVAGGHIRQNLEGTTMQISTC